MLQKRSGLIFSRIDSLKFIARNMLYISAITKIVCDIMCVQYVAQYPTTSVQALSSLTREKEFWNLALKQQIYLQI